MNQQTKTCQNCQNQFTIEPDDFAFYEKIQVPPPTWCPECRMVRRMLFMSDRMLFKRKDFELRNTISSKNPDNIKYADGIRIFK